ncbi:DsbA family protein [Modestobacter altitudinis]|uniref:DsbA family protein n=1 Tax=Modestobacter altitudinis TaxID=2213158 RepID=UPI00110D17BC|nr:thioredoxin domain-containing protein [Modestobacter altitudinis]
MSGEAKRAAARQRIAAERAAEAAAAAAAARRRRTVLGGVVAAVVLVVVLVAVVVVQTMRTSTSADAAAPANTSGNGYVVTVGQADAPVILDVYEDFQCPNCKALEDSTGSTIDDLVTAGTVQVRYHGMAFLDTDANDDYSTRALNAAAVVADTAGTEAYERFHDLLFAHQPAEGGSGLTDDQLVGYAEQAGATGAGVAADVRDLVFADWVEGAEDQASKDGVTGTPTVLVDGEELTDLSPAGLTAAVAAAQQ